MTVIGQTTLFHSLRINLNGVTQREYAQQHTICPICKKPPSYRVMFDICSSVGGRKKSIVITDDISVRLDRIQITGYMNN